MKRKIFLILSIVFVSLFLWFHSNYQPPILMYHSFDEKLIGKYASVSPQVFYRQMEFIKNKGYKVISLEDYCRILHSKKRIPHNIVIITIDDGYQDNLKAIEILDKFDFPATIFLIVNNIGKTDYLKEKDIRWFLKNTKVRIGSHTLTHAYLPSCNDRELEKEIEKSKKILEKKFGVKISTIAYPIGGFDKRVLEKVKEEGYLCGCTTNRGFSKRLNVYALRRIKITQRDLGIRLWAKLSGFYNLFRRVKPPY